MGWEPPVWASSGVKWAVFQKPLPRALLCVSKRRDMLEKLPHMLAESLCSHRYICGQGLTSGIR